MEDIRFPSFNAWNTEEYLSAESRFGTSIAIEKIAATVPDDGRIGPVGGGYIQHSLYAGCSRPNRQLYGSQIQTISQIPRALIHQRSLSGGSSSLQSMARSQQYLCRLSGSGSGTPIVPEVYNVFDDMTLLHACILLRDFNDCLLASTGVLMFPPVSHKMPARTIQ
jgi:hypothetical protein